MMAEEPGSPQEPSPTRIMEDVLRSLGREGSKFAIVPVEVHEEAGTSSDIGEEALRDKGLEVGIARG